MMDWRSWAYGQLVTAGNPLLAKVSADNIFGGGSMTGSPSDPPFIVLRFGPKVRRSLEGPYSRSLEVWVHDVPGDYLLIEEVIDLVRSRLEGQVAGPGAIECRWEGDSSDLADDGYGTITRNTSFSLVGSD